MKNTKTILFLIVLSVVLFFIPSFCHAETKSVKSEDYAFPCFQLAKKLKKSLIEIAKELKGKIEVDKQIIEKIEELNEYLSFYIKKILTDEILKGMQKEEYGKSEIGKGKTILVEYSSPNIAKPFYIGR